VVGDGLSADSRAQRLPGPTGPLVEGARGGHELPGQNEGVRDVQGGEHLREHPTENPLRFSATGRFAQQADHRVPEQLAASVLGGHRVHLVQVLRLAAGEGSAGSNRGVVSAELEQLPAEGHLRRVQLANVVFAGERHAQPPSVHHVQVRPLRHVHVEQGL
jgi:hypothetical protein